MNSMKATALRRRSQRVRMLRIQRLLAKQQKHMVIITKKKNHNNNNNKKAKLRLTKKEI